MSDDRAPLIAALIFGLAYAFITPPFHVPDENLHFVRGVAIAMGHLLPNGGGRPDSAHIPQGLKTLVWVMQTTGDFRTAYEIPLEPVKEPIVEFPAWYTPAPYVPQALTVLIARVLNVRPLVIFYAGRLANLLVALVLLAIALRLADGFRTVVAAVALLPMTLFELASWSADVLTIAASILFATLLIRAVSREATISLSEVVAMCATGFVVGICKPAYFLTALLVVAIPRRRFRSNTQRIAVILLVLLCVSLATLLAFEYANEAAYHQRTDLPIDPASQLRCIVSDPIHFVAVAAKDVLRHGWSYLEGLVAHFGFGGDEVRIPLIMTWLELLMLVSVAVTVNLQFRASIRVLVLAIFAATAAGVLASQYLVWSIVCGGTIEGVQGRYFLPVLPLALIGLRIPAVRRVPPMVLVVTIAAVANIIALSVLVRRY